MNKQNYTFVSIMTYMVLLHLNNCEFNWYVIEKNALFVVSHIVRIDRCMHNSFSTLHATYAL